MGPKKRHRVVESDPEDGSGSASDAEVATPDQEPGWPPRLRHTWDVIVAAAVQKVKPFPCTVGGWKLRDLGKPFPGGTNVRMFLSDGVVAELLRTRLHDVLHGFDAAGVSFCGFFEQWPAYAQDAAARWLHAHSHASAPRVFTSHDYGHRLRRTWTLRDVLATFVDCGQWAAHVRAAVRAGVSLGLPSRKETQRGLLRPFARNRSPELLRAVLAAVLEAPPAQLHWDFEVPFPTEETAWAAPVFDWFQAGLKALFVDDALRAAVCLGD